MTKNFDPSLDLFHDLVWGKWNDTIKIFEISKPVQKGLLTQTFRNHFEMILISPRLVGLIAFSGPYLDLKEIADYLRTKFEINFRIELPTPLEQASKFLNWLKQEQYDGKLKDCSVSLLFIVNIDNEHFGIWRVGGNGILLGKPNTLRFISSDQRMNTLYTSTNTTPEFASSNKHLITKTLSVSDLKSPKSYETYLVEINRGSVLLALNQSTLPFGPWPTSPQNISAILSLDAAWKYGLTAHGLIIGEVEINATGWPHDHRQLVFN